MRRVVRAVLSVLAWNHVLGFAWLSYWAERLGSPFVSREQKASGAWASRCARFWWGKAMFTTWPFWTVRVEGELPETGGPFIVVANHQSLLDTLLTFYADMDLRFVSDRRFGRLPMMGGYLRRLRTVFTNMRNPFGAKGTLEQCRQILNEGNNLFLFAEGTRTRTGEVGRFQLGAFRLACELNLPVVPVILEGTRDVLPADSWTWPLENSPSAVFRIKITEPILPSESAERPAADLRDRARERIVSELENMRIGPALQRPAAVEASPAPAEDRAAASLD